MNSSEDYNLQISKSANFVGPMGWGGVFYKEGVTQLGQLNFFVLYHKESAGLVGKNSGAIETIFEEKFLELQNKPFFEPASEIRKIVSSMSDPDNNVVGDFIGVCAIFIVGRVLYVASIGQIDAFLFRHETDVKIASPSERSRVVRGKLLDGDGFLITIPSFFESNALKSIKSAHLARGGSGLSGLPSFSARRLNVPYLYVSVSGGKNGVLGINSPPPGKLHLKDYKDYAVRPVTGNLLPFVFKGISDLRQVFTRGGGMTDSSYAVASKKGKTAASVGVILLFVLFLSIGFGIRKRNAEELKMSYQNDLAAAEHGFEQSLNIYPLNIERSRELFEASRITVDRLLQKGVSDSSLDALKERIVESQGKILGEYHVDLEMFVDLGLLTDNFKGDKIEASGGFVYALDRQSRKIVRVSLASRRSEVIIGPNKLSQIYDMAAYADRIYTVNSDGVFGLSGTVKKLLDESFRDNVLIAAFGSNLYSIDKNSSRILRYAADAEGFGPGKDWLASEVRTNLADVKLVMIDGSVWILHTDGKINRFSQGKEVGFNLSTEYVGNLAANSLFTSEDTDSLYVLDKDHGKIYVFAKDGTYLAQYVSDGLRNAVQIIVSEKEKKMILLNENKLFSIDLAHI